MLIGEEIELLKHGYLRCYYVSGYCSACGAFRLVAALAPDGEWCDCPQCGRAHRNCAVLGYGFTRRVLPEYTIMWAPLQFIPDADEVPARIAVELIAGLRPNVPAIAAALGVTEYRAEQIRNRAFPARRAHAR